MRCSYIQFISFFGVIALSVVFVTGISANDNQVQICIEGCHEKHGTDTITVEGELGEDGSDLNDCLLECTTSVDVTDLDSVDIDGEIVAPDTNAPLNPEETRQLCGVTFSTDDKIIRGNVANNSQQCMESPLVIEAPPETEAPPEAEPQQSLLVQALAQCESAGVQTLNRDEEVRLVDKVSDFTEDECGVLSLYATVKTIRSWLFFIAGALALLMIIFAGLLLTVSRNEAQKVEKAKKYLLSALFGFTLILISGSVLQILMSLLT